MKRILSFIVLLSFLSSFDKVHAKTEKIQGYTRKEALMRITIDFYEQNPKLVWGCIAYSIPLLLSVITHVCQEYAYKKKHNELLTNVEKATHLIKLRGTLISLATLHQGLLDPVQNFSNNAPNATEENLKKDYEECIKNKKKEFEVILKDLKENYNFIPTHINLEDSKDKDYYRQFELTQYSFRNTQENLRIEEHRELHTFENNNFHDTSLFSFIKGIEFGGVFVIPAFIFYYGQFLHQEWRKYEFEGDATIEIHLPAILKKYFRG